MKLRTILHTIETGGPGGAETIVLELASRLDPERFRSLVVLSHDGWLRQQLLTRGVETTLVEWKAWYDFRLPRAMSNIVRRENVALIHSHLPDHNFYSCLVGKWTRRSTIATYHGAIELAKATHTRNALKLWFVRRNANAVVAVCDHIGRILRQSSFPPGKIVRIYNGIEMARFAGPRNGHLRQELGCRSDTAIVGMIANIRQSKGYEFFIQAAREIADLMPTTLFLAIGDVDERIGSGFRALVDKLGLHESFRFLGFRSDVAELLSQLDVFVLSSTSEGFPLVVLEAMAAGKPVVVTRCGGPEEVVEDGRDGFLVPPGNPKALASRVMDLLHDPGLRATLGSSGQTKVRQHFSLETMVNNYEALYDQLLHRP